MSSKSRAVPSSAKTLPPNADSGELNALSIGVGVRLPRIWAVGISRLQGLYRALLPEFDARADWRMLAEGFDAAVDAITAAGDEVDVVVSAGSNGAYLRARLNKPVVLVNVTGIDL